MPVLDTSTTVVTATPVSTVIPTVPATTVDSPTVTDTTIVPTTTTVFASAEPVSVPGVVATTQMSTVVPTVVVKQQLSVKPFNGTSSWRTFRDHFNRICRINGWTDEATKVGHLTVSLEGPAAEVLRDIDESGPDAWNTIWTALKRRFGHVDDQREAMHKFDACKQTDDMTIPEYETKLRLLHAEAWPKAAAQQRDSDLKRRFEDGLQSTEMRQFLRLHAQTDNFEATVSKARQFQSAQEATKPKKAIRIVEVDHDSVTMTPEATILKGMESITKTFTDKIEQILTVNTNNHAEKQEKGPPQNTKLGNGQGRVNQSKRRQWSGKNRNRPPPNHSARDDFPRQPTVTHFRSPSPTVVSDQSRCGSPWYDDRRQDFRSHYPYRSPAQSPVRNRTFNRNSPSFRDNSPYRNQGSFRDQPSYRNQSPVNGQQNNGYRTPPPDNGTQPPGRDRRDGRQFNAPL